LCFAGSQAIAADDGPGRFLCLAQGRQDHRQKQGHNRDNDPLFNVRKCGSIPTSFIHIEQINPVQSKKKAGQTARPF